MEEKVGIVPSMDRAGSPALDNAIGPSRFILPLKAKIGGSPPFPYPSSGQEEDGIYRVHRGILQSGETALVVLGYDECPKDYEASKM